MSVKPKLALRFFPSAEGQPEFEPTTSTYCTLLHILSRVGLDRSAYGIMESIVKTQCYNVLESLINEYRDEDIYAKLLDFLLWVYTKETLIEDNVALFYRMIDVGIMPNIQNCNRVLKVLRDFDCIEQAREINQQMLDSGIFPSIVMFNTMLDSFCKEGNVQEALDFLVEMEMKRSLPNDVTYNVLISGLYKDWKLDKAKQLMQEMHNTGLSVSDFTYNPLIDGHSKKGNMVEAFRLRDEMTEKGLYGCAFQGKFDHLFM